MKALIDADIKRYEVGFAAEVGWRHVVGKDDALPPFRYVAEMLEERIKHILQVTGSSQYQLYLTEGSGFRDQLAVTKPYKGTRRVNKPWHYDNLSAHMKYDLGAEVVEWIEADDMLAIQHTADPENTIIVSRDKDLRQVPGRLFSWELGNQPSFGPAKISKLGSLELKRQKNRSPKLIGTGYKWFCGQLLIGDPVDNIPGCSNVGPVAAYNALAECTEPSECFDVVQEMYGDDDLLLEQGKLLWMIRRLDENGAPVMWQLGMEE